MSKKYFSRLEYIDYLIKSKSGGTPQQMARRLNISERTLFETADFLIILIIIFTA